MEVVWSNKDLAITILSRLQAKDLSSLKCSSKVFRSIISDPLFLRIHHDQQSNNGISGIFLQFIFTFFDFDFVNSPRYIPIDSYRIRFYSNSRVLLSTSNGIICCRSHPKDEYILVGTPMDKTRYIRVPGDELLCDETFSLAFYPFGSSSGKPPSFKLANMYRQKRSNRYIITIYSSETGKWKIVKEVCAHGHQFKQLKPVFANGRFNWLTYGPYIIAFDPEEERYDLIQLPESRIGKFVGESKGYLHCGFDCDFEVRIWLLQDYSEPYKWTLKYCLDVNGIAQDALRLSSYASEWEIRVVWSGTRYYPLGLGFSNDVLVIYVRDIPLISYNIRTRKHHVFEGHVYTTTAIKCPVMLLYSLSSATIDAFNKLAKSSNSHSMLRTPPKVPTFPRNPTREEKRQRAS